jgi:F-type H+-transporting ATPase subunit alpha
LDAATQRQLARGARIVEILKQPQYKPMPVEQQVMIIYAVTNGFLDDVPVEAIRGWEQGFHEFMGSAHQEIGEEIRTKKALSDDLTARLRRAIEDYKALNAPAGPAPGTQTTQPEQPAATPAAKPAKSAKSGKSAH